MNGSYVNNAAVFLVQTAFALYILAVMLRFLLQWVRADFYNPLVQVLVRITNPVLIHLRRLIPGLYGIDLAAVALMFLLQALELYLLAQLMGGSLPPATLVLGTVAKLLGLVVNVFFWTILIQVILSWVNPQGYNPAITVIHSLTEPLLRPARRLLPDFGGLDLSPLVVVVALQLVRMVVIDPLRHTAGLPPGF
jgi:YggT family protein